MKMQDSDNFENLEILITQKQTINFKLPEKNEWKCFVIIYIVILQSMVVEIFV